MSNRIGLLGGALLMTGLLLIGTSAALGRDPAMQAPENPLGAGFAGGMHGMGGMSGTADSAAMAQWLSSLGLSSGSASPGPGEAGFVAGTQAIPQVIKVIAGPGPWFIPTSIDVAKGETITFEVTAVGNMTHEFQVGPAADVAADKEGTPEVADLGNMQTKSLTYTFDGTGPYTFACHMPGHYEFGMRGVINVVS